MSMIKSWGKLHREISPKGRERIKAEMSRVLSLVMWIGLTLQLVLGIFWILGNLRSMQPYADSYEYLATAGSMRLDIGKSFLYPLFLRGIKESTARLHLTLFPFVYINQLLFAWFSSYMVLKLFPVKYPKVYACFLCTMPMVMQMSMAILPDSIALSLMLLLVRIALQENMSSSKRRTTGVMIWLLLLLFMPVYGMLSLPIFLWILWKRPLFVLGVFSLGLALSMLLPQVQYTLSKVVLERVSWPILDKTYPYWGEEIWTIIPPEDVRDITMLRGGISEEMALRLKEAVGETKASRYMGQITKLNFSYHSREVAEQLIQDGISCVFPPLGLLWELSGREYPSAGGRNYEIMKTETPGLTKAIVAYGNIWFIAGVILILIQGILSSAVQCGAKQHSIGRICLLLLTSLPVLGYGLLTGGGMMDYKRVTFIIWLWGLLWCINCQPFIGMEKNYEGSKLKK
jgi:hypothetical protein